MIKTLIADDHALVRAGLKDALKKIPDVEVTAEVGNGIELFNILTPSHDFDLLVMDVNMPEFEPITAVQRIKNDHPNLKILVVSAYDDQSYVVGLLSAGVNGYHMKDQPLSDLHLAVRRILDGSRWISAPLVDRLVDQKTPNPDSSNLTRRQKELLYLLTQGYSNQKISQLMEISVKTVENHLTQLYRSIGVESRLEASKFAAHHPESLSPPKQAPWNLNQNILSQNQLSVLVVDDNARYRTQLSKLIRKTATVNFNIHEAQHCSEAVSIANQEKPQLAFIDVILSDEDGIECVRRIKLVSPDTRIILISAYPDREFRRMGLNAGAIAFLDKKDLDAATVRQVVNDANAQ